MMLANIVLIWCTILATCAQAEERWVWNTSNRQQKAYRNSNNNQGIQTYNDKYRRELFERQREREPTTRRPLPGELYNEDIDDYPDNSGTTPNGVLSTRQQYPYYPGNAYNSDQMGTSNFGNNGASANAIIPSGFGGPGGIYSGYPGINYGNGVIGSASGILVGPGGPIGILGRPVPAQYPIGVGSGIYQPGVGLPNGIASYGGTGNFYTQQGYPTAQTGISQLPGTVQANIGQLPGVVQASAGQFSGVTGRSPGVPGAYPGSFLGNQNGQYPNIVGPAYARPQYTEGYGLAYTNGQPILYGAAPFLYDESNVDESKVKPERKSARVSISSYDSDSNSNRNSNSNSTSSQLTNDRVIKG